MDELAPVAHEVLDAPHNTGRWKPYAAYKDSGVEWLGDIPSHWLLKRVREHVALVNGYPFESELFSMTQGIPLIRIRDLATCTTATYYRGPKVSKVEVRDGDILVGMDGDFNVCWWSGGKALLNQRLCSLHPKEGMNRRFLFYLLPFPLKVINDLTWFTTVKHLSSGDILRVGFGYPPPVEQQNIAAFLDRETARIDALIQKKERLIELLQEKRSALISHAVTKGLDPTVPMKDSGIEWLGDIPAHWEAKRTKYVAELQSGHTPSRTVPEYWVDCTIPWVTLNDVGYLADHDYICETANCINEQGLANSSARLLPANTVIVSRDATVGRCGILGRDMATSQHFVNWICGREMVPEYLLFVFRFAMQQELMRLTMGSTLRTIGVPDVHSFRTPVPPIAEQKDIVSYVLRERTRLDDLSAKVCEAIDRLKEYRTALISATVTGKIDVSEEVPT